MYCTDSRQTKMFQINSPLKIMSWPFYSEKIQFIYDTIGEQAQQLIVTTGSVRMPTCSFWD